MCIYINININIKTENNLGNIYKEMLNAIITLSIVLDLVILIRISMTV